MVNPGMSNAIGAIRIRMKRGINLAVRDSKTSDPYIIVALGEQVLLLSSLAPLVVNTSCPLSCMIFGKFIWVRCLNS